MSEYIKKEDIIECLNDLFGEMYHVSFGNVLQSLDSLQTYSFPDSAENKGEWIEESDNYGHSSYFCSRCGTQEGKPSDICPNCRARMSNSENPNKWISVSERLPENDGQYLVAYDREDEIIVNISYFDRHGFWIGNVVAWMPLPEPYKAESEDT